MGPKIFKYGLYCHIDFMSSNHFPYILPPSRQAGEQPTNQPIEKQEISIEPARNSIQPHHGASESESEKNSSIVKKKEPSTGTMTNSNYFYFISFYLSDRSLDKPHPVIPVIRPDGVKLGSQQLESLDRFPMLLPLLGVDISQQVECV